MQLEEWRSLIMRKGSDIFGDEYKSIIKELYERAREEFNEENMQTFAHYFFEAGWTARDVGHMEMEKRFNMQWNDEHNFEKVINIEKDWKRRRRAGSR